jgi:hypothetical protein
MVITFMVVWLFRRVERRYLRHLDMGGGGAKAEKKIAAAGMPVMR